MLKVSIEPSFPRKVDLPDGPVAAANRGLRRVFLHGTLADPARPGSYAVSASTAAEAIALLAAQVPTLRPDRAGRRRHVKVVGMDEAEKVCRPSSGDIHIVPAMCGGKNGGFMEILIAAVLIAASFIPGNPFAAQMLQMGIVLLIGGILQLLNAPSRASKESSMYLGSPQNTVAIGTPIAILMGRRRVGGQFLTYKIGAGRRVDTSGNYVNN